MTMHNTTTQMKEPYMIDFTFLDNELLQNERAPDALSLSSYFQLIGYLAATRFFMRAVIENHNGTAPMPTDITPLLKREFARCCADLHVSAEHMQIALDNYTHGVLQADKNFIAFLGRIEENYP